MISLSGSNIGKRFHRNWVFRGLTFAMASGSHSVFLGGNGSGKSTLLKIISGFSTPSEGKITFELDDSELDQIPTNTVSMAAPYTSLYLPLTLKESIAYHLKFQPILNDLDIEAIMELAYLTEHQDKVIKNFSSGMLQRLKLSLAILSDTPLLLLDEPCSNLDEKAIAWYKEMMSTYTEGRTVVVATNDVKNDVLRSDVVINLQAS